MNKLHGSGYDDNYFYPAGWTDCPQFGMDCKLEPQSEPDYSQQQQLGDSSECLASLTVSQLSQLTDNDMMTNSDIMSLAWNSACQEEVGHTLYPALNTEFSGKVGWREEISKSQELEEHCMRILHFHTLFQTL